MQKYKEKGYSDEDAVIMANYDKLREEQGIDAAERYLQEQAKSNKSTINRGLQNASKDEINQAKIEILERINEIKNTMNDGEKSRTTYGVAKVKLADGSYEVWIASAGKKGYVRPDIRKNDIVKKNKTPAGNSINRYNDAEQTLMREANQNNAEILAMGASRPMCEKCQDVAKNNGIIDRMVTELK